MRMPGSLACSVSRSVPYHRKSASHQLGLHFSEVGCEPVGDGNVITLDPDRCWQCGNRDPRRRIISAASAAPLSDEYAKVREPSGVPIMMEILAMISQPQNRPPVRSSGQQHVLTACHRARSTDPR